ncbi:hypothetical protein PR048_031333 [Dryococelus australis]|uniref:Uncharacterized protein n=1 Tax=Dryococelus australis TaxID=614101 RepID=A0ABQ9G4Y9_9NEOP|nr:hypothetical protein PR048_031333 [Dryococelus australis]
MSCSIIPSGFFHTLSYLFFIPRVFSDIDIGMGNAIRVNLGRKCRRRGWYRELTLFALIDNHLKSERRNARARETGGPRENSPTSGIVWHYSHLRISGSDPAGDSTWFTLMENERSNSSVTTLPPPAPPPPQREHIISRIQPGRRRDRASPPIGIPLHNLWLASDTMRRIIDQEVGSKGSDARQLHIIRCANFLAIPRPPPQSDARCEESSGPGQLSYISRGLPVSRFLVSSTVISTKFVVLSERRSTTATSECSLPVLVKAVHDKATVAERLARSPATEASPGSIPGRVTGFSQVGTVPCRWSADFLGDLPFLPPLDSGADPYSFQSSSSSAPKTSLLRAAHISSLTLSSTAHCESRRYTQQQRVEWRDLSGPQHRGHEEPMRVKRVENGAAPECVYGGGGGGSARQPTDQRNQTRSLPCEKGLGASRCPTAAPAMGTVSTLASHQGELGSIPGRITGLSQVGIVPYDAVGPRGLLGDLPFSAPPPRSGALSIFASITVIGSQDPAVESHPNLFTLSLTSHQDGVAGQQCIETRVWGCGGVVGRLIALHRDEPGTIPGPPSGILACGNRARRRHWSAGFLAELPFLPPLHSRAAPCSPRFTLIGSQDLDVKSRPNLFTYSFTRNTETASCRDRGSHCPNPDKQDCPPPARESGHVALCHADMRAMQRGGRRLSPRDAGRDGRLKKPALPTSLTRHTPSTSDSTRLCLHEAEEYSGSRTSAGVSGNLEVIVNGAEIISEWGGDCGVQGRAVAWERLRPVGRP